MIFISINLCYRDQASAYEAASGTTDRKIIEALIELKAGMKSLEKRMDALEARMNNLESSLNERINSLDSSLGRRVDIIESSLNKRIDELSKRIDDLKDMMIAMFTGLIALTAGLIGVILWDRLATIKPMLREIEAIKLRVEDLVEDRIRLRNLVNALRELAQKDDELAEVLKSYKLM
jgi:DNA anti-recombination protein RmuC